MQSLLMPTLLMVQKSQLFWKKLGDDVILVQCPFKMFIHSIFFVTISIWIVNESKLTKSANRKKKKKCHLILPYDNASHNDLLKILNFVKKQTENNSM